MKDDTLLPLALWAKKTGGNRLHPCSKFKHGTVGWAEFEGTMGRTQFYFNEYLPKDTPWLERWMSLEKLRETPKPVYVSEDRPVGFWLKRAEELGRVKLIWPARKTEGEGRHPDSRTAPPIGSAVYT